MHPQDIYNKGHLDVLIRKLIKLGLDPIIAIQLATLNPAEFYGLKSRGAIAPGYMADIVILNNLNDFEVEKVYKNGSIVANKGKVLIL